MIVRRTIGVLASLMQRVGSVVGGARAGFIRAVFADEEASCQRMIGGRKAKGVAVSVAPRERLDRTQIVQRRPQHGTVAHTLSNLAGRCVEKRRHRPALIRVAERGVAAGKGSTTRVEYVLAQGDVLAWDIGLAERPTIGFADDA